MHLTTTRTHQVRLPPALVGVERRLLLHRPSSIAQRRGQGVRDRVMALNATTVRAVALLDDVRGCLRDIAAGTTVDGATRSPRSTRGPDQRRQTVDPHVGVLNIVAPGNGQRASVHPPRGQGSIGALDQLPPIDGLM